MKTIITPEQKRKHYKTALAKTIQQTVQNLRAVC